MPHRGFEEDALPPLDLRHTLSTFAPVWRRFCTMGFSRDRMKTTKNTDAARRTAHKGWLQLWEHWSFKGVYWYLGACQYPLKICKEFESTFRNTALVKGSVKTILTLKTKICFFGILLLSLWAAPHSQTLPKMRALTYEAVRESTEKHPLSNQQNRLYIVVDALVYNFMMFSYPSDLSLHSLGLFGTDLI